MDESEEQEFDGLQTDVERIDRDLVRLRKLEAQSASQMVTIPVSAGTDPVQAAQARSATPAAVPRRNPILVKGVDLPKATAFTRYAIALYFADGDRQRAIDIVQGNQVWMDQTPEVVTALRAPVAAGTTTTSGWASQLAPVQNLASEFVELLRPRTILGRIPGFRNVPFNVLIPRQTAGTEGDWVGEGARKPVGRLTVDNIEFKFTKIAKIVAITEELARFSNPSAEARVREDLIEGIQVRMDRTFVDPSVTASAGIRPASIFNGADTAAAAGTGTIANIITDVKAAMATFVAAELPTDQVVILTTPTLAVGASLMRTTLDAPAFPGMTPSGGNLLGFPVYVSSLVPSGYVEFFIPGEVLLADDGQANVDVSNQATLIMDDGNSPSATNSVNLWQENKIGIRAERFVNWMKRRDDSTYYITAANWGA
jgi:HK97 family phage major capsid protein